MAYLQVNPSSTPANYSITPVMISNVVSDDFTFPHDVTVANNLTSTGTCSGGNLSTGGGLSVSGGALIGGKLTNNGPFVRNYGDSTDPSAGTVNGVVQNAAGYFITLTGTTAYTLTTSGLLAGQMVHIFHKTGSSGTLTVNSVSIAAGTGTTFVFDGTQWEHLI